MGLSFSKDKNIDIYLNVDKQYYISGETVNGEVYLNVKVTRAYLRLAVKLTGEEYVSWTEGTGEDQRTEFRKEKNYQGYFLLRDFGGKVDQGQYCFPFSFLLPSMITGSFYKSAFDYLKYTLSAELENANQSDTQRYEMFLNIIEPPRFQISPTSITNHVNSKCCNCCFDYGITSVTLKSDKNFAFNGDQIHITGKIDNTNGKQNIKRCTIMLEEKLFMTTGVSSTSNKEAEYLLGNIADPISKGSSRDFSINARIPSQIVSYTAIGRIIARFFIIHLYTEYGCCANKAEAVLHIVIHSRTPKIVEKRQIAPPAGWSPMKQPVVVCNNLPPYMYMPDPKIPFLNFAGSPAISMPVNPGQNPYASQNLTYPQIPSSYQPPSDMNEFHGYQPVYYNSNMFNDSERMQQGYQPYFSNSNQ